MKIEKSQFGGRKKIVLPNHSIFLSNFLPELIGKMPRRRRRGQTRAQTLVTGAEKAVLTTLLPSDESPIVATINNTIQSSSPVPSQKVIVAGKEVTENGISTTQTSTPVPSQNVIVIEEEVTETGNSFCAIEHSKSPPDPRVLRSFCLNQDQIPVNTNEDSGKSPTPCFGRGFGLGQTKTVGNEENHAHPIPEKPQRGINQITSNDSSPENVQVTKTTPDLGAVEKFQISSSPAQEVDINDTLTNLEQLKIAPEINEGGDADIDLSDIDNFTLISGEIVGTPKKTAEKPQPKPNKQTNSVPPAPSPLKRTTFSQHFKVPKPIPRAVWHLDVPHKLPRTTVSQPVRPLNKNIGPRYPKPREFSRPLPQHQDAEDEWVNIVTIKHPEEVKPLHRGRIRSFRNLFENTFQITRLYNPDADDRACQAYQTAYSTVEVVKFNGKNIEMFREFEQYVLMKIINNFALDFDGKFHMLLKATSDSAQAVVQIYTDELNLENFVLAIEALYYAYGEPTKFRDSLVKQLLNQDKIDMMKPDSCLKMSALISRVFRAFGELDPKDEEMAMSFIFSSIKMTQATTASFNTWLSVTMKEKNLKSLQYWLEWMYSQEVSERMLQKSSKGLRNL